MRLIDKDELINAIEKHCDLYDYIEREPTAFDIEKIVRQFPTIDQWHYPSRGELPPSGEEVLCFLWGTTPDVGCWNEKDELWHFDEFEEETVDCWQYIIPPKEEA